MKDVKRFLNGEITRPYLQLPQIKIQPILAKEGKPSVDVAEVAAMVGDNAVFNDLICIKDADHWRQVINDLPDDVDAVMPVSIPCYPNEVWNEAPEALAKRGIPVIFWPLIRFDEPDFWKWSAADLMRALGIEVHLVENCRSGITLLRAMAVKKFLANGRMVVFGKQNFPWNVFAGGGMIRNNIGTQLVVKPLEAFREAGKKYSDEELLAFWETRKARYVNNVPDGKELLIALRTFFGIRDVLDEEKAFGFGVNCFGELVISGARDVPCLAQCLAREEGFIAACDGDYCAMLNMAMITLLLDKPCMMSNIYPLTYEGALTEHFGDKLASAEKDQKNLARLGHCGYVGVVSPEMSPAGKARMSDWGGTYEIKRDGSGCGIDCDLAGNMEFTGLELHFNGKDLLVIHGEIIETTRHPGMPHCESTALLRLDDLDFFIRHVSREHLVLTYGDHRRDLEILAEVLNLHVQKVQ